MSTATRLSVTLEPTDDTFIDYLIDNPHILNLTGTKKPSRSQVVQEALRALQKQVERQAQEAIDEAIYEEMAEEFNTEAARRRPALRRRISPLHAEA